MFKSILGRLFWTYATVLVLVFTSVSVSVAIFADRFIVSRHIDNIQRVADTIEYWTGTMQIEADDVRVKTSYRQVLKS